MLLATSMPQNSAVGQSCASLRSRMSKKSRYICPAAPICHGFDGRHPTAQDATRPKPRHAGITCLPRFRAKGHFFRAPCLEVLWLPFAQECRRKVAISAIWHWSAMALMGDTQLLKMQPVPSQGIQEKRNATSAHSATSSEHASKTSCRTVLCFPSLKNVEEKSLYLPCGPNLPWL